jgi:protein TonB
VSFITETAAAAAPAPTPSQPSQPTPPSPERQLLATPKPTSSPMTAPPQEAEPRREAPRAAQPAPAAPPANASPSAAAAPSARATGDPGATTTTPPNFNAAYLNNPRPVYPQAAKFRGRQGTVELRVQVAADGAPSQVLVSRSSGHSDLDAAALDVVKKRWRFVPAKQGDHAIVGWVIVPLEFSLTKSR